MRLAFIDIITAYDAARPDSDAPLGGTTSAVCFLTRELAKSGIACALFNRIAAASTAHNIPAYPLAALGEHLTRDAFDAYIFCGRWTAELVALTRAHTAKPLIAWMHESAFAPPLTPALDAFDAAVFVSQWQQRVNQSSAKPHWRQAVIRNAMNPKVAHSFLPGTDILAAKTTPPILLFAGAFARGAFHVPPLLDKIRAHRADFSAEIFCNLDPSQDAEKDAAYIKWMRAQPNIAHVGQVGQGELARRMRRAVIMLAPNPWPETSCIALIEGLASGMQVVATTRAALPETSSGFARLVPIATPDDQTRFDMPIDYDAFAAATLQTLADRATAPEKTASALRQQVDYFHENYQWGQRVALWMEFIANIA